jgi:hypothetical protein
VSPSIFSILLTTVKLGIQINAYLKRQRDKMSPEQRAEYDKACKESFNNAGSMSSGVGE